MVINLQTMVKGGQCWGSAAGRSTGELLTLALDKIESPIIGISLAGITRLDVPGARTAIVETAKRARGQLGFYLIDIADIDIFDNLDGAACKLEQPLNALFNDNWRIAGPKPNTGLKEVLAYLMNEGNATTFEVATALDMKIANTSNKLRELARSGYALRKEVVAPTGGIEHIYTAILPSKVTHTKASKTVQ